MATDKDILIVVAVGVLAYLVGSVNLSILASRLLGREDPRRMGSNNPGATNLLRTFGARVAVPVLLLDLAKAFGVIRLAGALGLDVLTPTMALPLLLGNLFPVFHGFKGGKGVATTVGAVAAIEPAGMVLGGLVFLGTLGAFKRVSLSSICMVGSYPLWIWLLSGAAPALYTVSVMFAIIVATHRANIGRLLQGSEPKIGRGPAPSGGGAA